MIPDEANHVTPGIAEEVLRRYLPEFRWALHQALRKALSTDAWIEVDRPVHLNAFQFEAIQTYARNFYPRINFRTDRVERDNETWVRVRRP